MQVPWELIGAAEPTGDARDMGLVDAVIQFELRGTDTKPFHYRIQGGEVKAFPGTYSKPDTLIATTMETWTDIVAGKIRLLRAYVYGKVDIQGDLVLAQRAVKLFSNI